MYSPLSSDGGEESLRQQVLTLRKRVAALLKANRRVKREMVRRSQIQDDLLGLCEDEKRRLGEEIHDGLCQDIAAALILCSVLFKRLELISQREVRDLQVIIDLLNSIMLQAKEAARGLNPVHFDEAGLRVALEQLARIVSRSIPCEFQSPAEVLIADHAIALNLYRIAQKAVARVIDHAQASRILIRLERKHQSVFLAVADDGKLSPQEDFSLINYQARSMGASLKITRHPETGTKVVCSVQA